MQGLSVTHRNFFGGYAMPAGAGNVSLDPQWSDPVNGDLSPSNALLMAGVTLESPRDDKRGRERQDPPRLGAIELAAE